MKEQHKILTIGNESMLLPVSATEADIIKLLSLLSCAEVLDVSGNYIPTASSRYGETIHVLKNKSVDVEVRVSCKRVLTEGAFKTEHAEGEKLYADANPQRSNDSDPL